MGQVTLDYAFHLCLALLSQVVHLDLLVQLANSFWCVNVRELVTQCQW